MRCATMMRSAVFALVMGVCAGSVRAQVPEVWAPIGEAPKVGGSVTAFAVFDAGTGPRLYAAGTVEGETASGSSRVVVRFDGTEWRGVDCPYEGQAHALLAKDDGNGMALFVGGLFRAPGGASADIGVLRYDGTTWSALPGAFDNPVQALAAMSANDHDVYAGGYFTVIGGIAAHAVARWDGTTWNTLGAGIGPSLPPTVVGYGVLALVAHDDGTGRKLYASGDFLTAGGQPAAKIARWDGTQWSTLGSGIAGGYLTRVYAMASDETGATHALYAGGEFQSAGGVAASHIARWSNGQWSALGSGVTASALPLNTLAWVTALAVHDDGTGGKLYAGGRIGVVGGTTVRNIACWNGSVWSDVAGGVALATDVTGEVDAFAAIPGSTALAVGGAFDRVGDPAHSWAAVAAFGGGAWSALGTGIDVDREARIFGTYPRDHFDVLRLAEGDRLIASGEFRSIDGVSAEGAAMFDGAQWTRLDEGLLSAPTTIAVHDGGSGPALYAWTYEGLYRRGGALWTKIDTMAPGTMNVQKLFAFDAGNRERLYAIEGEFELRISEWTGTSWTVAALLPVGATHEITKVRVLDLAAGRAVVIAGRATAGSGMSPAFVARWSGGTIDDYVWMGAYECDEEGNYCSYDGHVDDMTAFDFGQGREIVVCGKLLGGKGISVRRLAPAGWEFIGTAIGGSQAVAKLLLPIDDGRGETLTMVTEEAGQGLGRVRYMGGSWTFEPTGIDVSTSVVCTYDDGGGSDLVVWGRFAPVNAPTTRTIVFAHSCLDGHVGAALGRPERSLAIGPIGMPTTARSVDLALGQPFTLAVRQPSTTSFPANFLLVGLFGAPTATTAVPSPFGLSAMPLPGYGAPSFWITSNLSGAPGVFGSTPAPWTLNHPGLPFPVEITIQGAILDASSPYGLALTNGIVVRVGF